MNRLLAEKNNNTVVMSKSVDEIKDKKGTRMVPEMKSGSKVIFLLHKLCISFPVLTSHVRG